jgi:hypothetical protein
MPVSVFAEARPGSGAGSFCFYGPKVSRRPVGGVERYHPPSASDALRPCAAAGRAPASRWNSRAVVGACPRTPKSRLSRPRTSAPARHRRVMTAIAAQVSKISAPDDASTLPAPRRGRPAGDFGDLGALYDRTNLQTLRRRRTPVLAGVWTGPGPRRRTWTDPGPRRRTVGGVERYHPPSASDALWPCAAAGRAPASRWVVPVVVGGCPRTSGSVRLFFKGLLHRRCLLDLICGGLTLSATA